VLDTDADALGDGAPVGLARGEIDGIAAGGGAMERLALGVGDGRADATGVSAHPTWLVISSSAAVAITDRDVRRASELTRTHRWHAAV
jgi:hypothetical protein